jgi:hypothetical protein
LAKRVATVCEERFGSPPRQQRVGWEIPDPKPNGSRIRPRAGRSLSRSPLIATAEEGRQSDTMIEKSAFVGRDSYA